MGDFEFSVYICWRGDEDQGTMMEKTIRAAFQGTGGEDDDEELYAGIDRAGASALRQEISALMHKKIPVTGEFGECRLFGDYEEPRTAFFGWEDDMNCTPDCFEPLFRRFPGLEFYVQLRECIFPDDTGWHTGYIYRNGGVVGRPVTECVPGDQQYDRLQRENQERKTWLGWSYKEWLAYFQTDRGQYAPPILDSVPEDFKTPELCFTAVRYTGSELMFVPEDLKTPELCRIAVVQAYILGYVPEELKTAELCLAAVTADGEALDYVPEKLRTAELYLVAVTQWGGGLGCVPGELMTTELCLAAVTRWGGALEYVPGELKTAELCLAAVTADGEALKYVPDELRTAELCLAAVTQSGEALKYVPEKLRTLELCLAAVNQNQTIVLTLYGKSEEVTKFSIDLLPWKRAEKYCRKTNARTLEGNNWVYAAVIPESETIKIKKPLTTVKDINVLSRLDDRSIQRILREVETETLELALKDVSAAAGKKIFRNLSRRAGIMVKEDLDYNIGPAEFSQVLAAQNEIILIINELIRNGEIIGLEIEETGYWGEQYDYDQAAADYTEAVSLDPNDAEVLTGRENAFREREKGYYDRAIVYSTEAVRLNPNDAVAFFRRGNAYYEKGDYDQAIADYTESIMLDPNDPAAFLNRGMAWFYKGDYDRLIADLTEAVRLDPSEGNKNLLETAKQKFARGSENDE